MPHIRQRDASDCGPACLAMVARHYGRKVSLARLRSLAGTDAEGTTALGLVEAARHLGLQARGLKGPVECLDRIPLPAIAHWSLPGPRHHFVVLSRRSRRGFRVLDPAKPGPERMAVEEVRQRWTGILILLAPGLTPSSQTETPASRWTRLFNLIQPYAPQLLLALGVALGSTLLTLASSLFLGRILDVVIPDENRTLLPILVGAMLLALGFRILFGIQEALILGRVAQLLDATLILDYLRHLLRLPLRFHQGRQTGELLSRINDAFRIRSFISDGLVGGVLSGTILICSLGALFVLAPGLGWLALLVLAAYAVIILIATPFCRRWERQALEQGALLESALVESIQHVGALQSHNATSMAGNQIECRLIQLFRTGWKSALAATWLSASGTLLSQGYLVALLCIGARRVLDSGMTSGELMTAYALAGSLLGPAHSLLMLSQAGQSSWIAADRVFDILDEPLDPDQGTLDATRLTHATVEFRDVRFSHRGRRPILRGVNCQAFQGQLTALVGPSGSGKSTLLTLIQRHDAPESGRILLGGTDLMDISLTSLRRQVGYLPQHAELMTGSVLENIALGDPKPDMERVHNVCAQLGLSDVIHAWPGGFQARLADHGANLSGGQRQRIALARVLYPNPRILLLDEPTTGLDTQARQQLSELLRTLTSEDRTVIVATHDAELARVVDTVWQLDLGVITARP